MVLLSTTVLLPMLGFVLPEPFGEIGGVDSRSLFIGVEELSKSISVGILFVGTCVIL